MVERNVSVVNAGMTKQETFEIKINVYRLVALKNWKEMERDSEKRKTKSMLKVGWKALLGRRRGMKTKEICGKNVRSLE
jgi:hypothetical protein